MPCLFHVYGYRPFSVRDMKGAILLVRHAQKLNPEISVGLVGNLKVFVQHADGIASQPHPAYPTHVLRRELGVAACMPNRLGSDGAYRDCTKIRVKTATASASVVTA